MSLFPITTSPTISVTSVPSLRRLSISTNGSTRHPQTPKLRSARLQSRQAKGMSHTSSKTWISPKKVEVEKWRHVKAALHRFKLKEDETSGILPWKLQEWYEHRQAAGRFKARQAQREVNKMEQDVKDKTRPPLVPMAGKYLLDNREPHWDDHGAVLGLQTIWCPNYRVRFGCAMWPEAEERVYEGDDRISTGKEQLRKLPIIRVRDPSNKTVTFSKLPAVVPYWFDNYERPLTGSEIYDKPDPVPEEEWLHLLGDELLAALDENEFSVDDKKDNEEPHRPKILGFSAHDATTSGTKTLTCLATSSDEK